MTILLDKLILERVKGIPGLLVSRLNLPLHVDTDNVDPLAGDGLKCWPVRQVRPAGQRKVPVVMVGHNLMAPGYRRWKIKTCRVSLKQSKCVISSGYIREVMFR